MRTTLLLLVIGLSALAGCFGGDEAPAERRVMASGGVASAGWAYDGEGVIGRDATLEGILSNADNTGVVNATATVDGRQVVIRFERFAQAPDRAFMDGGVAFNLDEHGDTGVADASIPRIHALIAAWGQATVLVDGEPLTTEPWSAHLMVSRDTVRGADGKITKADGTTPYDPATPGDARRIENDPQAILWVKHPQGETFAQPPTNVSISLACQGPQCAQTAELPLDGKPETLTLNLSAQPPNGQLPIGALGRGRIAVLDANGTELAGVDVAPQPAPTPPTPVDIPLEGVAFPLTVQVTGEGAFNVLVEGVATYTSMPFLVLTWDDVTVE